MKTFLYPFGFFALFIFPTIYLSDSNQALKLDHEQSSIENNLITKNYSQINADIDPVVIRTKP